MKVVGKCLKSLNSHVCVHSKVSCPILRSTSVLDVSLSDTVSTCLSVFGFVVVVL